jgi:hypothetical protein
VAGVVAGEDGETGFSRRSRLTIAGGVRGGNWSEGPLRCSWSMWDEAENLQLHYARLYSVSPDCGGEAKQT